MKHYETIRNPCISHLAKNEGTGIQHQDLSRLILLDMAMPIPWIHWKPSPKQSYCKLLSTRIFISYVQIWNIVPEHLEYSFCDLK